MKAASLQVESIVLGFGGLHAVDGVSFEVAPGETFGIVGPNGAGKTSLLNCINGFYSIQSGAIRVNGTPVQRRRPHQIAALGVARTFQTTEHFREFAAIDYVLLGRLSHQARSLFGCALSLAKVRASEAAERARALAELERLGLADLAQTPLAELPYGVLKRVDIGRALFAQPEVLLMDEPTSGTVSRERPALKELMARVRKAEITTVVVDHDLDFIAGLCDRILVMNYGKMLAIGTPGEVLARADVRRAYLGE